MASAGWVFELRFHRIHPQAVASAIVKSSESLMGNRIRVSVSSVKLNSHFISPENIPMSLIEKYSNSLNSRPILTKAITSSTLYTLQELIAAAISRSPADASKALRMTLYGFFVSGPMGHFLYAGMESLFTGVEGAKAGLMKLLFSNLIITPIQNSSYLFALGLIAGASPLKALQIVRQKLLSLMKISWVVSPLAQIFAFKQLEPRFYVPFFNFVAFIFGTVINIQAKLEAKKNLKKKGTDDSHKSK